MSLEERLEHLERELAAVRKRHRRHQFGMLALIVALAAGFYALRQSDTQPVGDGVADTIRARSFVLYDIKGNARGLLAMNEDTPALILTDENGRPRVGLFTNREGSSISLSNEKGVVRAGLTATAGGVSSLNFNDDANQNGMVLGTAESGPSLRMMDANGISRLVMGAAEGYPVSSIRLNDEKAAMIWRAP